MSWLRSGRSKPTPTIRALKRSPLCVSNMILQHGTQLLHKSLSLFALHSKRNSILKDISATMITDLIYSMMAQRVIACRTSLMLLYLLWAELKSISRQVWTKPRTFLRLNLATSGITLLLMSSTSSGWSNWAMVITNTLLTVRRQSIATPLVVTGVSPSKIMFAMWASTIESSILRTPTGGASLLCLTLSRQCLGRFDSTWALSF